MPSNDRKMTIAIDFDNTLVSGDKMLPGARAAMQQLNDEGHYLLIYSCNNAKWVEKVLDTHDVPYHEIYGKSGGKPVCDAYIDDRNVEFDGDWQKALESLSNLEERDRKIRALGIV